MLTFNATYSPDDNKLRLYASGRLDKALYDRVRTTGFIWAPKQELFVAPMWTPSRADLCEELAGEIGDEDKNLVERAEERAERFEDYSEKRAADADNARRHVSSIADGIPFGQPILIGHHSERHARRDAEKIESGMRRAVKMWETSKYWIDRAQGALAHAQHAERADVRARRIKKIEADKRKAERETAEATHNIKLWAKMGETEAMQNGKTLTVYEVAVIISNRCNISKCFTLAEYPRELPKSQYEGLMSIYSALTDGIITPEQARDICIRVYERSNARRARWIEHYNNRLAYERAMLGESGYILPPKKPTKAALPILNYGGEVQYKNRYSRGEIITTQAHGMTKAEFAAIYKDYKGTFISADGTHRIRSAIISNNGTRGLCAVYLTDSKQHTKPGGELITREQQATAARIEKGQRELQVKIKQHADIRAHNKLVIAGTVAPSPKAEAVTPSADFDAMRESLRAGVQVITAPQLFPTPLDLAARMVELAGVEPGARVLEPSAGTGNIAAQVARNTQASLLCVEVNQALCSGLQRAGYVVQSADFLETSPDDLGGVFDCVIMNPPFENAADIKHILHAQKFLRDGGRLVAICADGPRQRAALMPLADLWEDLPPGTFKNQGTNVNTALVVIQGIKP
jgi:16S rRNA G1207 methylase RsmC